MSATTNNNSKKSSSPVGELNSSAGLGALLGNGYYRAQGMVMTPFAPNKFKGDGGKEVHMSKQTIICGASPLTLMSIGDTEDELHNLHIGELVRIEIRSSKTEKGQIQVSGEVTILTIDEF